MGKGVLIDPTIRGVRFCPQTRWINLDTSSFFRRAKLTLIGAKSKCRRCVPVRSITLFCIHSRLFYVKTGSFVQLERSYQAQSAHFQDDRSQALTDLNPKFAEAKARRRQGRRIVRSKTTITTMVNLLTEPSSPAPQGRYIVPLAILVSS